MKQFSWSNVATGRSSTSRSTLANEAPPQSPRSSCRFGGLHILLAKSVARIFRWCNNHSCVSLWGAWANILPTKCKWFFKIIFCFLFKVGVDSFYGSRSEGIVLLFFLLYSSFDLSFSYFFVYALSIFLMFGLRVFYFVFLMFAWRYFFAISFFFRVPYLKSTCHCAQSTKFYFRWASLGWIRKTRQDKTRQNKTSQGKTRRDKARQDKGTNRHFYY